MTTDTQHKLDHAAACGSHAIVDVMREKERIERAGGYAAEHRAILHRFMCLNEQPAPRGWSMAG